MMEKSEEEAQVQKPETIPDTKINKSKERKKHAFYITLLLIILLVYLSTFMIKFNSVYYSEYLAFYPTVAERHKISMEDYKDAVPLWNPFSMCGEPFFAAGGTQLYYLITLFSLILPSNVAAVKMASVLSVFFAGVSMYALVYYLLKRHRVAFLSAFLFMFNGWTISRFKVSHLTTLSPLPLLPLVILFTIKATRSKDWIKYAIITGILFGLQIHVGPDLKITLWAAPLWGITLLFTCIGKRFGNRLIKASLIAMIVISVMVGVSAVKVFPTKAYIDMSSRSNVAFERTLAGRVDGIGDAFSKMIEPIYEDMPQVWHFKGGYNIGIFGFLLMLLAVWKKPKNKNVLLFSSMVIFSLFIVTGSFVWYLIWKYVPAYSSFRYLHRTFVLFIFPASVLAGIGLMVLLDTLKKRGWSSTKQNILFIGIMLLIILNLQVFNRSPYREGLWVDLDEVIEDNHILQNISKRPGIFRMHVLETTGIDWTTENQMVPLKLKQLYSPGGMWLTEYMNEYLAIAQRQPAKFWGILNVRYITSQQKVNITGLEYQDEFERCYKCWPDEERIQKVWGPYLYENKQFLNNAYIADKAILIIGEKEAAKQSMYGIMLDEDFDPSRVIMVLGRPKVSDYNPDFLKRFNAVLLAQGSVGQNNDVAILRQYVEDGGKLLPNIVEGENSITNEDIKEILIYDGYNNRAVSDEDVTIHSFDKKEVNLIGEDRGKFLVMSERYAMFPGWEAKAGNKDFEILRTNGVVSSIYLDGDYQSVVFEYKPPSFYLGLITTLITVLLIMAYLIYRKMRKKDEETH